MMVDCRSSGDLPERRDVMLALGAPRFGWFRMLYMSARNCSRMRSLDGLPPAHDGIPSDRPGIAQIRFGARSGTERVRCGAGECGRVEPLGHVRGRIDSRPSTVCVAAQAGARESACPGDGDRDRSGTSGYRWSASCPGYSLRFRGKGIAGHVQTATHRRSSRQNAGKCRGRDGPR